MHEYLDVIRTFVYVLMYSMSKLYDAVFFFRANHDAMRVIATKRQSWLVNIGNKKNSVEQFLRARSKRAFRSIKILSICRWEKLARGSRENVAAGAYGVRYGVSRQNRGREDSAEREREAEDANGQRSYSCRFARGFLFWGYITLSLLAERANVAPLGGTGRPRWSGQAFAVPRRTGGPHGRRKKSPYKCPLAVSRCKQCSSLLHRVTLFALKMTRFVFYRWTDYIGPIFPTSC